MGTWSLVLNDIYQIIFNRVTLRTAAKRPFTHLLSKKDQLPPRRRIGAFSKDWIHPIDNRFILSPAHLTTNVLTHTIIMLHNRL